VVTTEEHTVIGGLGGAVAELLSDRHPVPVKRHGLADIFGESGPDEALLEKYGLSAAKRPRRSGAFVSARADMTGAAGCRPGHPAHRRGADRGLGKERA